MEQPGPISKDELVEFLQEVLGIDGLHDLIENTHLHYVFDYKNTYFLTVRADALANVCVKVSDARMQLIETFLLHRQDFA